MRIFYTTILSRYKFYRKSHVNLKAWFFFDSFLVDHHIPIIQEENLN